MRLVILALLLVVGGCSTTRPSIVGADLNQADPASDWPFFDPVWASHPPAPPVPPSGTTALLETRVYRVSSRVAAAEPAAPTRDGVLSADAVARLDRELTNRADAKRLFAPRLILQETQAAQLLVTGGGQGFKQTIRFLEFQDGFARLAVAAELSETAPNGRWDAERSGRAEGCARLEPGQAVALIGAPMKNGERVITVMMLMECPSSAASPASASARQAPGV